MTPLILFVALGLVILVLFEWRARRQTPEELTKADEEAAARQTQYTEGECCGQHLVCEREKAMTTEIVYYDDEELDTLRGIAAEDLTDEQADEIRAVYGSLLAKDIPGWVRSIEQRGISLPSDVREEALLIVREERSKRA